MNERGYYGTSWVGQTKDPSSPSSPTTIDKVSSDLFTAAGVVGLAAGAVYLVAVWKERRAQRSVARLK